MESSGFVIDNHNIIDNNPLRNFSLRKCHPFNRILRRILNRTDVMMCDGLNTKSNFSLSRLTENDISVSSALIQPEEGFFNIILIFGLIALIIIAILICMLFIKVCKRKVERDLKRTRKMDTVLY